MKEAIDCGISNLKIPTKVVPNPTRPTLERRKTLGHLRSINRNMIIHFANQSQTCQFLKNLTRSLYVASFLAIFFFFFFSRSLYAASVLAIFILFLLHFRSVSLYTGIFPAICIFTLLRCCSYSLNSGSDLALLFHSAFYCCLISLHFTDLSLHLSLADSCDNLYIFSWPCQLNLSVTVNIYQQLPVPLKTRSENQRLQNFYSIIHPYSTCTESHQDFYSLHVHLHDLHSVCSIFQRMFCLPLSHLSVALSSL